MKADTPERFVTPIVVKTYDTTSRPHAESAQSTPVTGARSVRNKGWMCCGYLDSSRMDTDSRVKVGLGRTAAHRHREALRHFARMRPAHVQSHHAPRVGGVHDELRVAVGVHMVGEGDAPFKWLKVLMVHLDVGLAKRSDRVLLGVAHTAILERRVPVAQDE